MYLLCDGFRVHPYNFAATINITFLILNQSESPYISDEKTRGYVTMIALQIYYMY